MYKGLLSTSVKELLEKFRKSNLKSSNSHEQRAILFHLQNMEEVVSCFALKLGR